MGSKPFNSIDNCIIIFTLYYCPFMLPINLIMFYPRCLQLLKMKLEFKYWLENTQINTNCCYSSCKCISHINARTNNRCEKANMFTELRKYTQTKILTRSRGVVTCIGSCKKQEIRKMQNFSTVLLIN